MLSGFWRILAKRPLATQMVASGVIGATGDAICQFGIEKRKLTEYDLKRGARFFFIPALFIAPVLSRWFRILERIPGNPKIVVIKRVLIDQFVGSPCFNAAILYNFFFWESLDVKQSWERLKDVYVEVYLKSLQFWPFVQLINFYFMPLNFRVVFVQLASLIWNSYLSFKTQTKKPSLD